MQYPCFSLQSSGALRIVQLLATWSKAANGHEGAAQPALCRALIFPRAWRRQTLGTNESGPVRGCIPGTWPLVQTSHVYPQNRPWLDWVKRLIPSKKKVFIWQGMVVVFEMKMAQGKNKIAWLNDLLAGLWLPLKWYSVFSLTRHIMVGFSSLHVFLQALLPNH